MNTNQPLTIADLKHFIRCQSIRDSRNYDANSWRIETNSIRQQRRRVQREFQARYNNDNAELIPGDYFGTRLRIERYSIDYIPGQYSPTEIWDAVHGYFYQTNS